MHRAVCCWGKPLGIKNELKKEETSFGGIMVTFSLFFNDLSTFDPCFLLLPIAYTLGHDFLCRMQRTLFVVEIGMGLPV